MQGQQQIDTIYADRQWTLTLYKIFTVYSSFDLLIPTNINSCEYFPPSDYRHYSLWLSLHSALAAYVQLLEKPETNRNRASLTGGPLLVNSAHTDRSWSLSQPVNIVVPCNHILMRLELYF